MKHQVRNTKFSKVSARVSFLHKITVRALSVQEIADSTSRSLFTNMFGKETGQYCQKSMPGTLT
jgi:hypothetical protein